MDQYCTMSKSTKVIKKKKKLKSATKFFICFRLGGQGRPRSATGGNPVFTCVAVGDKEAAAVVCPVGVLPGASKEGYHQPPNGGGQQKNKEQRKISRVLKAILFETSLARKIRTKKLRKGYESSSLRYNHLSSSEEDDPKTISKTSSSLSPNASIFSKSSLNSSSSSASSSSSSSRRSCSSLSTTPSRTSNSRSLTERIKSFRSAGSSITSIKANSKCLSDRFKSFRSNSSLSSKTNSTLSESTKSFRSNSNINLEEIRNANDEEDASGEEQRPRASFPSSMGLCFLLMGLLGLIFWGKICGIVCASSWLFSLPFWSFGCHDSWPVANKVEPPKTDHSLEEHLEHKKKVVVGGLLARLLRPACWRRQQFDFACNL